MWRNILHPHRKLTNMSSMLWMAKLLLKLMAYSYIIYQISCLYVHYKTILWPTNIFKVIFRLYRITYATIFCLLINLRTLFSYKIGCSVKLQFLNIFLLEVNFDKSTIGLHLLFISSMLAKFLGN